MFCVTCRQWGNHYFALTHTELQLSYWVVLKAGVTFSKSLWEKWAFTSVESLNWKQQRWQAIWSVYWLWRRYCRSCQGFTEYRLHEAKGPKIRQYIRSNKEKALAVDEHNTRVLKKVIWLFSAYVFTALKGHKLKLKTSDSVCET